MSTTMPSLLVPSQVPEFIAADAPRFVEFLQAYYEFLGQYNRNIQKIRDIDETSTQLVSFLKNEFAARYPSAVVNDRKLIRIIRDMYRAKGTFSAVEMLFRIFFNEAITIQQPGENILRASDGRWLQEHSITVRRQFGAIDYSQPIVLRIENDNGVFFLEVDRFEILSNTDTRFFYKSFRQLAVTDNQYVDIVTVSGTITYRGLLIKSPSTISIVVPGKNWKLGQVIAIKSTEPQVEINGELVDTLPTIARVSQIGPNGELLAVEIVQYGTFHPDKQTALVNPYPNKPPGANEELFAQVISVEDIDGEQVPRYAYTLNLFSQTDGISESLYGLSNARGADSYFLEDYINDFYTARVVLQQETETQATALGVIVTDPSLTYAEWLASRAVLVYDSEYIVKYKGVFSDDRGQLSNTNIRLQDNYFYQLFSYVIQTTQQIEDYRNSLNMIHPAGLKYFGELTKTSILDLSNILAERVQSRTRIFLAHGYVALDVTTFDVVKPLFEDPNIIDDIVSFEITKALSHIALLDDSDRKFDVTKALSHTTQTSETVTFDATKALSHIATTSDPITFDGTKVLDEQPTVSEVVTKDVTPATIDEPLTAVDSTPVFDATKNLEHIATTSDPATFDATKNLEHIATTSDPATFDMIRGTEDEQLNVSSTVTNDVTRGAENEQLTVAELFTVEAVVNVPEDITFTTDPMTRDVTKLVDALDDQPAASDADIKKDVTLATIGDTTDASDGSSSINTSIIDPYITEDYFGEIYIASEFNLTIG